MTLYREQQRGPPNKDQNALGPLHHRFGSQLRPTPGAQPPKRRGRGALPPGRPVQVVMSVVCCSSLWTKVDMAQQGKMRR
jgi:hypothetical protein